MNKKTLSFFKICHLWIGLIGGWFLFILFISGTISIFDKEITQWMQPELGLYSPTKSISAKALDQAFDQWEQHKNIRKNLIALPSSRDPYLRVLHAQDNILQGVVIDPQQGNIIPVRATGGGYFFDSVHSNLFIGRSVGGAIVLIISIAFFIVLITGIIIYLPNMIRNAFSIYAKPTSLRFKSDLHTIIGIFFLPFLFTIAISGFLFLAPRYLPNTQPQPLVQSKPQQSFTHPNKTATQQKRPELLPLLNKAENYFKTMPSAIFFTKNEVRFIENEQNHIARLRNYIAFDRKTNNVSFSTEKPTFLSLINKTLLGIHTVRAGDLIFRTIFALMGIGSAILVACGLLFYTSKKRNSILSTPSISQLYFYKTIEGINIGILMGTLIATISFFWLNRLLPVSLTERISWEITGFFTIFFFILGSSIFSCLCNKTNYAWIFFLSMFSSLCIFLPVIDYIQTSYSFQTAITHYNYLYLNIDIIIFFIGIIFLRLYFYMQKKGAKEC